MMKRVLWTGLVAAAAAGACFPWWSAAGEPWGSLPTFTESEIRSILSHGPWPPPPAHDPSNRVSGKPEAIELGERLFFETRLSGGGQFSCATCHVSDRNWTDNETRSTAVATMDRNTPTLMNVRLGRWFGWGGSADSLWAQSIRPILDPRELASNTRQVAELIRKDDQLNCRYRKAYGAPPSATDDEAVLADVGKALAAFQETLQTGPTAFDAFRDALARGERPQGWRYSEAAQRGLKIFIGKGNCSMCHTGPNFTNGEFHDTGLRHFAAPGRVDPGRHQGIKELKASPFNLLGRHNDDPTRATATKTRHVTLEHRNFGEFKVPSLRNMLLTAPYAHDGQLASLADVVRHYSELNLDRLHADGESILKPLKLTAREQIDLVVFLESLTTFSNPWRAEDASLCQ